MSTDPGMRDAGETGQAVKPITLALQGGGAHGAFAWGVLDRLLEDGRLAIEGVSATSAGAMGALNGEATRPWAEAILMMRPQSLAFMPGSTALITWNAEDRLMATIASHLSSGISSVGATCWMPALFTMTSTLPNSAAANLAISRTWPGWLISAGE